MQKLLCTLGRDLSTTVYSGKLVYAENIRFCGIEGKIKGCELSKHYFQTERIEKKPEQTCMKVVVKARSEENGHQRNRGAKGPKRNRIKVYKLNAVNVNSLSNMPRTYTHDSFPLRRLRFGTMPRLRFTPNFL